MSLYPIFVEGDEDEIRGFVAYGLHKRAKRQWRDQIISAHGREPTAQEITDYERSWTDQLVENSRSAADAALSAFGETVIENARPGIVEAALKGNWVSSIWQSMAANALYTLALLATVIILKAAGIDLLSALVATSGRH